jgi:hypothetical protein
MTKVIERTDGHYEAHEEHYGKRYVWCPGHVVAECQCGESPVLSASETRCRCGADHVALIGEEPASGGRSEAASYSLDKECHEWRKKQDEYLVSEETYWLELSRLD